MSKLLLLAAALLAPLALVAPAHAAKPDSSGSGAEGNIGLTVHTHSSEYGGPGGNPLLLEETDPLSVAPDEGENFSYIGVV